MMLGQVVGQLVATRKDPRLAGEKLLLIRPYGAHELLNGHTAVLVEVEGQAVPHRRVAQRNRDSADQLVD